MKKIKLSALLFFLVGCQCGELTEEQKRVLLPERKKSDYFYRGPHQLRRMFEDENKVSESSGYFFFGIGQYKSSEKSLPEVRFAWQENLDSTFVISRLPLEKIRVKLDSSCKIPSISFVFIEDCDSIFNTNSPENIIEDWVHYAKIRVSPKMWPQNIKLPL